MNNEGNKEWVSIRMKKNDWAGKRTEICIVEIWMWYTPLETSGKFCLKEPKMERTLKNTPGEGSHSCLVHQVDTQGTPHLGWEHINPRFFSQLSQLISITWSQNSRTPALWVPKSPYSNLQFEQWVPRLCNSCHLRKLCPHTSLWEVSDQVPELYF